MSNKGLRIANDLVVPLDAVTQKIAWLGRTGSGKTYGAKRMVEQMLGRGVQVVIVDPVGVWAGLRLAAPGTQAFDVPVLGGLYGDIPLEPAGGAVVADVVVDRGTSVVLDVSQMLDAERTRFATGFGERFFQRKKASPSAVHVVLEECQELVPQNPQGGEERMLHEWQRIAKLGRNFGIGMSFISQRPQEVNKKALNQVECVFAFQLTGPQERKALQYWLSDKGADEKLADVLPKLRVGEPHVWSPQWLEVSRVVKVLPIATLDTSQTPKVGERAFEARKLTPIDLADLRDSMAATIERAKADDPKTLRARIAELEKQAKGAQAAMIERVDVPVLDEARFGALFEELQGHVDGVVAAASSAKQAIGKALVGYRNDSRAAVKTAAPSARVPAPRTRAVMQSKGSADLKPTERALLTAFAQSPRPLSTTQAAIIAGYSPKSGGVFGAMAALRKAGFVDGDGATSITDEGIAALGHFDPLPVGPALAEHWYGQLNPTEAAILRIVVAAHPNGVSSAEAAEQAGYSPKSGGVFGACAKLRKLELVHGSPEMVADERLV